MIRYTLLDKSYRINFHFAANIGINQSFNELQPNHFSANHARKQPMQAGSFIGDTEQGGSCNVNELTLNPHCNGTHTETIAHICDLSHPLTKTLDELHIPALMPCVLITVEPEQAINSSDSYSPAFMANDNIITRASLERALEKYSNEQLSSVVIRTLPNPLEKQMAVYDEQNQPAFFSHDAILYLNERGVEHLVTDLPSFDRLHDDGELSSHHLFWQVPQGMHQPLASSLVNKTITELAYINNDVQDGFYFISLQTPSFSIDAAPARVLLYFCELVNE